MTESEGNVRTCENGHTFEKTSMCPTCPICEAERAPETGFLSTLSAPARGALKQEGIETVRKLSQHSEAEILDLHGVGPASLPALHEALEEQGLDFKEE